MNITSSLLGYLLVDQVFWRLSYIFPTLMIEISGTQDEVQVNEIIETQIKEGFIWARLEIQTESKTYLIRGILNSEAQRFNTELQQGIEHFQNSMECEELKQRLRPFLETSNQFFQQNIYLSHTLLQNWKKSIPAEVIVGLDQIDEMTVRSHELGFEEPYHGYFKQMMKFIHIPLDQNQSIAAENSSFVSAEVVKFKDFFDQVDSTPLTNEQRKASVIFEDRNLLVAAAGSGKTSTIVGKVGYALLKGLYTPNEILVLAFNANAAKELRERIAERLEPFIEGGSSIEAHTFHGLGQHIIAETTQKKPSIDNDAGQTARLIERLIQQLVANDSDFREKLQLFRTAYAKPPLSPFEYKTESEWKVAWERTWDRYKQGYLTFQGETVKSYGEKAIANWLYSKGIPYAYEQNYPHSTVTADHRQYQPDFYLPEIDTYLEHYAVNERGQVPSHFGQRYKDSMAWKATIHQQYGTDLITTTFAEFISGQIFEKLEKLLKERGQIFKPRSYQELMLQADSVYESQPDPLFSTFLSHYKSNQASIDQILRHPNLTLRERLFLELFRSINIRYEAHLLENNAVDFDDLILNATQLIHEGKYRSPYKLILVDEFQDISQARARLVLALLQQRLEAKLFCVGDDWQAIYRFAGSDISIFTKFREFFGYSNEQQLTQTFRSNQGIANVASTFVQKNPSQLKKMVKATDSNLEKVVEVVFCESIKDRIDAMLKIATDLKEEQPDRQLSIYILGRYNSLKPDDQFLFALRMILPNAHFEFKTIHRSKGLQADIVILLGLNKGANAFPSEIEDDPLLNMVLPEPELYPCAEERRLFYVALTRAKQKVYLLGEKRSVFLEEILAEQQLKPSIYNETLAKAEEHGIPVKWLCPKCQQGRVLKRKGKFGYFQGCNRYPECKFTRTIKFTN
jgi:DNA helicase-4